VGAPVSVEKNASEVVFSATDCIGNTSLQVIGLAKNRYFATDVESITADAGGFGNGCPALSQAA